MEEEKPASFKRGARVTYGNHGICTVEGVETNTILDQDMSMVLIRTGTGQIIKAP